MPLVGLSLVGKCIFCGSTIIFQDCGGRNYIPESNFRNTMDLCLKYLLILCASGRSQWSLCTDHVVYSSWHHFFYHFHKQCLFAALWGRLALAGSIFLFNNSILFYAIALLFRLFVEGIFSENSMLFNFCLCSGTRLIAVPN